MAPTADILLQIARECEAFHDNDHFVFQAGSHSDNYCDMSEVIRRPTRLRSFARAIAWRHKRKEIRAVCGPLTGGALLAQMVAEELTGLTDIEVELGAADKDGKALVFKRSYAKSVAGMPTLVVDDTVTEGDTLARTIALVRATGGIVVAVAAMARRKVEVTTETLGIPDFTFELDLSLPSWSFADCHLCHDPAQRRAINTKLGHGRKFLDTLEDADLKAALLALSP